MLASIRMGQQSTSSTQSTLRQAVKALQQGNLTSAASMAQEILRQDKQNIQALLILAYCSSPLESMAFLQQAEEIAPGNPSVQKAVLWGAHRLEQAVFQPPATGKDESPASGFEAIEEDEEVTGR